MTGLACGVAMAAAPAGIVYATAVLSACSMTLTRPVHNALLPELATTPSELTAANSVSSSAEGIGITVGPLLNAALIAWRGPQAVLLVFAFVMGGVALLTIRLDLRGHLVEPGGGVVGEALEGFRALRDDLPAAGLPLFVGAQYLVLGMLDIFLAVLAIDVLRVGEDGTGILAAGIGIGGMIGGLATAVLIGRRRLAPAIEIGVGAAAGTLASLALVSVMGRAFFVLVAAGAARSFFDVAARTLLQRSIRPDVLSRVFGLQEAMRQVGLAIGSAVAPVFVSSFGYRGAFIAGGVLLLTSGVAAWPSLRLLDRRASLPDPSRFALLSGLDLFAPLPQRAIEQLAVRSIRQSAPPNTLMIREGEPGDFFYVIVEGSVEVDKGGTRVAMLGPGSYVGEIALLRDVPRTATVRSQTQVELLILERDDFLDAVTGSRRSARVAEGRIDQRIAGLDPGL
jgi:predicted MFS family arabinose efflux permease